MDRPDKSLLSIDRNNLEEECCRHPQLAFEWGEKYADAKRRLKEAENRLKLASAQTERDVRQNPTEYSVLKVTEDSVKSAVIVSREYQRAFADVIDAQHEEDILFAFVMALNARKDLIGDLVKLFGQQYWSKPAVNDEYAGTMRAATMRGTGTMERPHKRKVEQSE